MADLWVVEWFSEGEWTYWSTHRSEARAQLVVNTYGAKDFHVVQYVPKVSDA